MRLNRNALRRDEALPTALLGHRAWKRVAHRICTWCPSPGSTFVFIILSTLRPRFLALCAFTGLCAGVEYAWLAAYYPHPAAAESIRPRGPCPARSGMAPPGRPAAGCGLLAGGDQPPDPGGQFSDGASDPFTSANRVVSMFRSARPPARPVVDQLLNQGPGAAERATRGLRDVPGLSRTSPTFAEHRRPGGGRGVSERTCFAITIEVIKPSHRHREQVPGRWVYGRSSVRPIADASCRPETGGSGRRALEILDRVAGDERGR